MNNPKNEPIKTNVKLEKRKIRAEVKRKISQLSPKYCKKADQVIYNKVIRLLEYQQAKTIFCYVSTASEIDTMPLLKHALGSGKILAVPKCIDKSMMEAYEIRSLEELQPGKYGILEPISTCSKVEPTEIDLCIAPCLACTKEGVRLGFGGGYYDRYLKKTDAIKMALCRGELLMEKIPIGRYDVKMDGVVTELEVKRVHNMR